jgi:hypothetical protein
MASPAQNDYSKGPSALDKASQLFFFSEIVRGEYSHVPTSKAHAGGRCWESTEGHGAGHPVGGLWICGSANIGHVGLGRVSESRWGVSVGCWV